MLKLTFVLLTAAFAHASASVYAQKASIHAREMALEDVFTELRKQTGYHFLYMADHLKDARPVNLDFSETALEDILRHCFEDQPLTFRIRKNRVLVDRKQRPAAGTAVKQLRVAGTVTGMSAEPLPGVSVLVKGTNQGTATDLDGRYELPVEPDATLVFSFMGYATQEVPVNGRNSIDVQMEEDTQTMDEVVVVGYGTVQRSHLTGAAGTVKMDETLASRPVIDFGQAMYGKVAGVQVLKPSGRPGESSRLQIRGVNSISAGSTPLIVVDGVPLPDFDLNSINSADIQSIDVLKDAASAAIYGSRGANGVILVTTKNGKPNVRTLSVNYAFTTQQVMRKVDVMNSAEYAQAAIDAAQIGWIRTGGDPDAPNTLEARGQRKYTWPEALEHPETLYNTDWQDVIFRAAPMHKADVSFSGGDTNSQYYLSFGTIAQEGIVIGTDYDRYNIHVSADTRMTDWLKVGGMINAAYDKENATNLHVLTANQYPSIYPLYGEDGYLGGPQNTPGFEPWNNILFRAAFGHPYYRLGEIDEIQTLRGAANVFAEFTLIPSLKFKSSFRTSYRRNDRRFYENGDVGLGSGAYRQATYLSSMGRTLNYTTENLLIYNKEWNGHQVDAVAGYEFNKRNYYGMDGERRDYDHDRTPYLSAGNTIYDASDGANESALISFLGRVNYNYKEKYMASATFRRDGSSRFGPENKWGNFPSFSAGWRISEEEFLNQSNVLNRLTLRASYGLTGNDNFDDYRWISRTTLSRSAIGDNLVTTYYPSSVENPDLRWERTRQFNIGLDLGLWEDRVRMEMDVYKSRSDGLLLAVPVPSTSGFTSVFQNIGELQNKGVEISLSTQNITTGKLSWLTDVTFARNKGKILKLGPDGAPLILTRNNMSVINQVGQAPFSFFAYDYLGAYGDQAAIAADGLEYPYTIYPGMGRYRDVNQDGKVNSDDRTIVGNAQPDFTWSFINTLRFGNFDLSILWHGSVGGEVYDANWRRSMFYHEGRNYLKAANDRWRSEADPGNGYVHALTVDVAGTLEREASSYWVLDGSYTRLKDVTLGYVLPQRYYQKIGLSKVRVYFNGSNLLTFQKTTTIDPENSTTDAEDAAGLGVQFSPYPSARMFSFGVNVQL